MLDRKKLEMEKVQSEKQRLLGFDSKKKQLESQPQPNNSAAVKGPVVKSRQTVNSQVPTNKGSSFAFENTYVSAETESPTKVSKIITPSFLLGIRMTI